MLCLDRVLSQRQEGVAGLGALAAWTGGARVGIGTLRVAFWGAVAMAATAVIGKLAGTVVV